MRYAHMLLLAAITGLAACTGHDANAGEPSATTVRPVEVATVVTAPLAPPVIATGIVAGKEEIPLAFKIGGQVGRITVDAGQRVRAGEVLAELSQAEIGAMTAKAVEGRTKARRDLDRVRALYADSVATLAQLQDATTALELAEQDAKAVQFNRDLSVIRAPAAGVVLQRLAEQGAMISPGSPILRLRTERRGVVLRVGLADRDAMRVRLGDVARISLGVLPGEAIAGRVTQVAAAASPGTGTFEVEVTLGATTRPLASGLIARTEIAVASTGTFAMLPLDALVEAGGDTAVVFVVPPDANVAERRVVRIAQLTGNGTAAISSGIAAGERVVVRGGAYLLHGSKVVVTATTGTR